MLEFIDHNRDTQVILLMNTSFVTIYSRPTLLLGD